MALMKFEKIVGYAFSECHTLRSEAVGLMVIHSGRGLKRPLWHVKDTLSGALEPGRAASFMYQSGRLRPRVSKSSGELAIPN